MMNKLNKGYVLIISIFNSNNILMKIKTLHSARILIVCFLFIQMPMLIAGNNKTVDVLAPLNDFYKTNSILADRALSIYENMQLDAEGLSRDAFIKGWKGYHQLLQKGILVRDDILTIADFSKPSSEERLFIIDLCTQKILFKSLVAHGKNTGTLFAESFSNRPETNKSSLGFYLTLNTYEGEHGVSLRLKGLEKNINDKAYDRAIVMHGAPYVSKNFANQYGFLGRSLGCPAIPDAIAQPIIQTIKNGSLLFIYHPTKSYAKQSALLNQEEA
jgi:hypothetical protein